MTAPTPHPQQRGSFTVSQRLMRGYGPLAVLALGVASAVLVLFAPQIVGVYASPNWDTEDRELAITFARFFLPQVLFYGLGAIVGAYLNTKGRDANRGPSSFTPKQAIVTS